MSFNVKPEQEMSFESTLIPEGTLVRCTIAASEGPKKANTSENYMLNWELHVNEGPYKGSKFYDYVGTSGTDGFVTMGKMKMSYVLESSREAHLNGNYEIASHAVWPGMQAIIKVGVEVYKKKDGSYGYKNVARAYGSPRMDSRNHGIYEDYFVGNQPYQTDKLPPLPKAVASNGSYAGAMPPAGHPAFDDALGF